MKVISLEQLVGRLTPDARFYGASLGLMLCHRVRDEELFNPVVTAIAPGVTFGDFETLQNLCERLGLDLSLACASGEDAGPFLRLERRPERGH